MTYSVFSGMLNPAQSISAWAIDHVSDAYSTTLHNTLFTILFFNSILKLPTNSFFLFVDPCLPNAIVIKYTTVIFNHWTNARYNTLN